MCVLFDRDTHTSRTVPGRKIASDTLFARDFADFSGAGKTPAQIVAHIGDLFEWALRMAKGDRSWSDSPPLAWEQQKQRFFSTLAAFEAYLASDMPIEAPLEKLFHGPIADALTHVGQLAMMRRLAGCPMKGENYFLAQIEMGRVGTEQAKAAREFD
ncbi:MAG TPA: hypothetical protein VIY49_14050 [Bryobacteraceae bacterium]